MKRDLEYLDSIVTDLEMLLKFTDLLDVNKPSQLDTLQNAIIGITEMSKMKINEVKEQFRAITK
jgi:hypothetical protein